MSIYNSEQKAIYEGVLECLCCNYVFNYEI